MPIGATKFGLMAAAGAGAEFVGAFGGIIKQYVDSGDSKTYRTHTFRGSGKFYVPSGSVDVDYLIIAGGGGGAANMGGGGGAGGVLQNTSGSVTCTGTLPIVVGTGGYGSPRDGGPVLSSGVSSSAFGLTAIGGGSGAGEYDGDPSYPRQDAAIGGSGGGGDYQTDNSGAAGTAGQGNAGGDWGGAANAAAGGGGAGAVGSDSGAVSASQGGNGGAGDTTLIGITSTDSGGAGTITYAGGGGGGVYGGSGWVVGIGGSGLGGTGGSGGGSGMVTATDSVPNTGSGGGGGGNYGGGIPHRGGDGSTGIVIIRYDTGLT